MKNHVMSKWNLILITLIAGPAAFADMKGWPQGVDVPDVFKQEDARIRAELQPIKQEIAEHRSKIKAYAQQLQDDRDSVAAMIQQERARLGLPTDTPADHAKAAPVGPRADGQVARAAQINADIDAQMRQLKEQFPLVEGTQGMNAAEIARLNIQSSKAYAYYTETLNKARANGAAEHADGGEVAPAAPAGALPNVSPFEMAKVQDVLATAESKRKDAELAAANLASEQVEVEKHLKDQRALIQEHNLLVDALNEAKHQADLKRASPPTVICVHADPIKDLPLGEPAKSAVQPFQGEDHSPLANIIR